MIMGVVGLLKEKPNPSEAEVFRGCKSICAVVAVIANLRRSAPALERQVLGNEQISQLTRSDAAPDIAGLRRIARARQVMTLASAPFLHANPGSGAANRESAAAR